MGNNRPPPIDRHLLAGLNKLERVGPRGVGADYVAATVVEDELIIWVTSKAAAARATKLAGELARSERVRVQTVGDRFRHATMKDIFDALGHTALAHRATGELASKSR